MTYSENEKEFMINVCGNCSWLYDCDNNAHEEQWKECMSKSNGKVNYK